MHVLRKPWLLPLTAFLIIFVGSWSLSNAPAVAAQPGRPSDRAGVAAEGPEGAAAFQPPAAADIFAALSRQEPPTDHSGFTALAGPFETPQEVTAACIECHYRAGAEVMDTIHWTWSTTDPVTGQEVGKNHVINNYCMAVPSNEPRCTSCHAGYGFADASFFETATEEDVDCLVCHDTTGTYRKFPAGAGYPVLGEAREFPAGSGKIWEPVDLVLVAQNVGDPSRANCGSCHFTGGGGDAVKHGDLDTTLLNPRRDLDVHMATDGPNFTCATCHAEDDHVIAGRLYNGEPRVLCEDCHSGDRAPHQESEFSAALTMHTENVACQTCHIPAFARGQPTKMSWDWSTAGDLTEEGATYVVTNDAGEVTYDSQKGTFTWARDVTPVYGWWNGTTFYKTVESEIDPSGVVPITDFQGGPGDGKIYPFKRFTGVQPYDAGNATLVVPNLFPNNAADTAAYWRSWDWNAAIASGMAYVGADFSGQVGWVDTEMLWVQNHMVAPSEQALTCTDCHTDGGRLDFAALGYTPQRARFLQTLFAPGEQAPPHQNLTQYAGPETCLTCHAGEGQEVAESVHYTWVGGSDLAGAASPYCDQPASDNEANWLDMVEPEDGSLPAQPVGCAQWHVGLGPLPNPPGALTAEDAANVDCLLCHGPGYSRTVTEVNGELRMVPTADVDIVQVLQNVGRPTNEMCLGCHGAADDGTNFRHGVAAVSSEADVHVASGVQCVDCHQVQNHRFGGVAVERREGTAFTASCTDCHDGDHPVGFTAIDMHLDRVACQTCHIPAMARDPNAPTALAQDWTDPVQQDNGLYAPATETATDVTPTYRWWNGEMTTDGGAPLGDRDDEAARITPWQPLTMVVPTDASSAAESAAPLKLSVYAATGDVDRALARGAELAHIPYSGEWTDVANDRLVALNHQVAPAAEALHCPDCHTRDTGRLDFQTLGYTEAQAADLVRISNAADVEGRAPFGGGTQAPAGPETLDYIVDPAALQAERDATRSLIFGIMGGAVVGLILAAVLLYLLLRHRGITNRQMVTWVRARRWGITAVVVVMIVAGLGGFLSIHYLFEFTASVEFCGTLCHATQPEYVTYHTSLHANVACVECHVGPGLGRELQAKMNGVRELYLQVTDTYERPIPSPVETLRPARETCEQCHWPEVFYADRAVEIPHFANDEANSRTNTFMLLKIGGGTERMGQGQGIHWHIENKVEYIATDPQRQDIPWVRAQIGDETLTFVDVTNPLSEEELAQYEVREMDCIDCHNRASHIFRSTDEILDEAMANGLLPTDLPYLRREAYNAMEQHDDFARAISAIEAIPDFYRENYPAIYTSRQAVLTHVVEELKDMYATTHFPAAQVNHTTYPDNLAHSEDPGCFRCHDGKHYVEDDGDKSIRLHCTICHTIPRTVAADEPAPEIPFQSAWQPDSHLSSTWIADHRYSFDATCNDCHEEESFCANPNCHGRAWPYVDLSVSNPPFPLDD